MSESCARSPCGVTINSCLLIFQTELGNKYKSTTSLWPFKSYFQEK